MAPARGGGVPLMARRGGSARLAVSNLDPRVTNQDIKELFGEVGPLLKHSLNFDARGRSKGSAEVVFRRAQDAQAVQQHPVLAGPPGAARGRTAGRHRLVVAGARRAGAAERGRAERGLRRVGRLLGGRGRGPGGQAAAQEGQRKGEQGVALGLSTVPERSPELLEKLNSGGGLTL